MSKQKTEIRPGQIWRDKRDHSRMVRVTSYGGEAWDKSGKVIDYDYEVTAGAETPNQRNGRPVKEQCFRGDYELVSAPTEAQKESK